MTTATQQELDLVGTPMLCPPGPSARLTSPTKLNLNAWLALKFALS
jgi:hypothetical protein